MRRARRGNMAIETAMMPMFWSAYHLFWRKFSPTAPKMALMPDDGFISHCHATPVTMAETAKGST